jgi:hypothetical protein
VLSGIYITLSLGKRCTVLKKSFFFLFIFMLLFTLSPVDFNGDVMQYISVQSSSKP